MGFWLFDSRQEQAYYEIKNASEVVYGNKSNKYDYFTEEHYSHHTRDATHLGDTARGNAVH